MFIVFEGIEGSGKSTQSKMLYEYSLGRGKETILTREPGGTGVSEKIRDIIINEEMTTECEAFLFAASRAEHTRNVIVPALKRDAVVICDRYVYSSYAMQSIDLGLDVVKEINKYAVCEDVDLIVYLDTMPSVGLGRKSSQNEMNKFEEKNILYHENVRENYLNIFRDCCEIVLYVDTIGKGKEDVHREVVSGIEKYFGFKTKDEVAE